VHRDPELPTATVEELLHPHQRVGTPAPSPRGERGNWHHNKNPARGNISSIPLSEEHYWSSRRKKKTLKTSTTGAQEIKILTKKEL
jgi:hypothetical protein